MSTTTVADSREAESYYGHLVSATLRRRLANRLVKDCGVDERSAAAIVDGTLGYLKLCADHPGHQFAPSESIDLGWHTFLLYTHEYGAFCEELAGRFIHHAPDDDQSAMEDELRAVQTVDFMTRNGIWFDEALWQVSARCTGGGSGGCRYTG